MRNKSELSKEYNRWLREAGSEKDLLAELSEMDGAAIVDAWIRHVDRVALSNR